MSTPSLHFPSRALVPALSLSLIAAFTLVSCSNEETEQHLTSDTESFIDNLAERDLDADALAEDSVDPDTVFEATSALEQAELSITLDEVEEEDSDEDSPSNATAEYTVTWDLTEMGFEDEEWSYSATSEMTWDDDSETWQPVLASDSLVPGMAEDGQLTVSAEGPHRGEILDEDGEAIVTSQDVKRIGIDKGQVDEETAVTSARELAELIEADPEAAATEVAGAGDDAFIELITIRADGSSDVDFSEEDVATIDGALAVEDTDVLGPSDGMASAILGSYGEPSAEQVEASEGDFTEGEPTGLSGLQRTWNDELSGTDGMSISVLNPEEGDTDAVDSDPVEHTVDPTSGQDVTSTLNTEVQELAEETIADSEVPAGLVVMRPSDGHVLAAANGPSGAGFPISTSGNYAPGSTFKVVTALSMLRNGMTPESEVQCPEEINAAGAIIGNFDGYPSEYLGDITLADAIAQSCNTTFVGQWDQISAEQETSSASALGIFSDPVTGLDGSYLGSVPDDSEGSVHSSNLFGQGVVESSPLGMATVAASVEAGHTVSPVFVSDPEVDPSESENYPAEEDQLTEEEAEQLQELMSGTVEYGTVPILQDVPGAPVYAKTGTAQFMSDDEMLAHTWIMATHGDIAVSLFFNEGFAGAQTNGPVLQEFLTDLEDIVPSEGTESEGEDSDDADSNDENDEDSDS